MVFFIYLCHMKDKLLKLVQACINDNTMYEHTYHASATAKGNCYRGINERHTKPRTSYTERVEYKGKEISAISTNSKYYCDLTPYNTQKINAYEINIGFGEEPQLSIRPVLKGNKADLPRQVIKVEGTVDRWLTRPKIIFDVTVVTEVYHYELRCGNFNYIVDESVVKDFFKQITNKRIEIALQLEENEINKRFKVYGIK